MDLVHLLDVDDDAAAQRHRAVGQPGAAVAGDDRDPQVVGDPHDRGDLLGRGRQDDDVGHALGPAVHRERRGHAGAVPAVGLRGQDLVLGAARRAAPSPGCRGGRRRGAGCAALRRSIGGRGRHQCPRIRSRRRSRSRRPRRRRSAARPAGPAGTPVRSWASRRSPTSPREPPTAMPSDWANSSCRSTTSMSCASPASDSGRSDHGQALTRVSTSSSAARSRREVADLRGQLRLLDRQATAAARAVGPLGHPVDVLEAQAGDRAQQLARLLPDALALVEPARVVVRDRPVHRHRRGQPALAQQLGQHLDDEHDLDVELLAEVLRVVLGEADVVVRVEHQHALRARSTASCPGCAGRTAGPARRSPSPRPVRRSTTARPSGRTRSRPSAASGPPPAAPTSGRTRPRSRRTGPSRRRSGDPAPRPSRAPAPG